MKLRKLDATNAELRFKYAPRRTWVALTLIGGVVTLVRNALYGIPVTPVRVGLTPWIVGTLLGTAYLVTIEIWLLIRNRGRT